MPQGWVGAYPGFDLTGLRAGLSGGRARAWPSGLVLRRRRIGGEGIQCPGDCGYHQAQDTAQIAKYTQGQGFGERRGRGVFGAIWYTIKKGSWGGETNAPFRDADQHGCVENTETATCQMTLCDQTTFQTFANLH